MNRSFCSGSSNSSSADDTSPRDLPSLETLSISSTRINGSETPLCLSAFTTRPGNEPMYVRRWPLISASSDTPPRLTRSNFLSRHAAIDLAIDVLPVPGGPTSSRIGGGEAADACKAADACTRRSIFMTATYSTMRFLTSPMP